jgi:outer membrane protein assembly factor BamA
MRIRSLAFAAALACAAPAWAEPATESQAAIQKPVEDAGAANPGLSFVAMPIPISNPAIGNGLAVAALMIFTPSGSPRPWTTGAGGVYTDTKSWGAAVFQKAYIDDDRFRVTAGAGGGVFNVKFYGIGQAAGAQGRYVNLEQDAGGGLAEVLMRVAPQMHVGLRYRGAVVDSKFKFPPPTDRPDLMLPELSVKSAISQLGFSGEYDSRDNEYNPNSGTYAHSEWMFSEPWLGSDFKYDLLNVAVNHYHRIDDKSLIAWRGSICHAGDGAPFYDICNFGANNDLRGYPAGQYRDQAMFALQTEYRRHLFWRLGAAAFVGVGEVAKSFGKMNSDDLLPAAGLGLRFEASKKYKVNASIDFAVGDHVSAAYFYIGEAF